MTNRRLSRPLGTQAPLAGCLLGIAYICGVAAIVRIAWTFRAELREVVGDAFGIVIGAAFTVGGVFFLLVSARSVGWLWVSRRWATGRATIISSRVRENDMGEGGPNTPEIHYLFEVAGKRIESDCVRLGGYGHGDAECIVEFCTPGRSVRVYYDPSNPARCCLQRFAGGLFTIHFTGLFFAVLGIVALVLWLSS